MPKSKEFAIRMVVITNVLAATILAAGMILLGLLLSVLGSTALAQAQTAAPGQVPFCEKHRELCPPTSEDVDYKAKYVGHDEPALLFYSNKPGSGNSSIYFIKLPKDPP